MSLTDVERDATGNPEREAGHLEEDLEAAEEQAEIHEAVEGDDVAVARLALALAFPVLACSVMVGGVFTGANGRIWAAIAGLLGVGVAALARRIGPPLISNLVIVVGLFAVGLICIAFTGVGNITRAQSLASQAAASGEVLRPPVDLTPGWQAIVGWLMGIVGFATLWIASVVRKPSLALLVPLPLAAIAGISVPDDAQVPSGVVVLVLFAIGMGLLSSARQYEEGARVPLSYEMRKFAKSLPVIAVITVALILLAQTDFLFPDPQIDPAEEPQRPRTQPLDEVEDRVLFEVGPVEGDEELLVGGPFRLGTLDVYDGVDWRLPAFNDTRLEDVPENGVVNPAQVERRGIRAEFRVAGLGGAALPSLPNTVLVVAQGPKLAYDTLTNTLRVSAGQAPAGLRYQVAAARLPTVEELSSVSGEVPSALASYDDIPAPPPAVQRLVADATSRFDNAYQRFDFVRTYVLENVVATGAGTPVAIDPDRVQEILGDTLEASPFEIVAMQAMLGRWLGLPARIAYGYDCGTSLCEENNGALQVRPRNGISFPEVYFPEFEWVPFIGTPRQARPSVGNTSESNPNPDIEPSNDIAVQIYLPALTPPPSTFTDNVKRFALLGLLGGALIGAGYIATPAVRKARARARRRNAARAAGPRARIALAYAEWRDYSTDYGFGYPTDTPLMYLDRFVDDAEHAELAWLTTRALWGDLQASTSSELASAAEELSRALRNRLGGAQPATMRFVATVSRLSLKDPYAPETDLRSARKVRRRPPASTPDAPTGAPFPTTLDSEEVERVPSLH